MHTNGVYHLNVNCSDLEHSLAFHREVLGLDAQLRTAPEPQSGEGFGLEVAQWDAWILSGSGSGPVLDLLEWKVPKPGRAPLTDTDQQGFALVTFGHPDPSAVWARCERRTVSDGRTVGVDPDGALFEVVQSDTTGLEGVEIGVADQERAAALYQRFGLELRHQTSAATTLVDPGNGFAVTLRQLSGSAEAAPREANDLGLFRMAWLTTDIDADHAELVADGVHVLAPPVTLDMGLEGGVTLRALFLHDHDGACLELIEPPR